MGRIIGILLLLAVFAGADYIVDQPDAARGKDARIHSDAGFDDRNYGVDQYLSFQAQTTKQHVVIQFDTLNVIPLGATIDSAYILVTFYYTTGSAVWYVAPILREWNEGTKSETTASTGEVTWNSAKHNEVTWTTDGAMGEGTDRTAPADSQVFATFSGARKLYITNTVQSIVDNGYTNGMVFFSTASTGWVAGYSSDYSTAGSRPKLEVWFTEGAGDTKKQIIYWIDEGEEKLWFVK